MPYRDWERLPSWGNSPRKCMYPLYSWGAPSDKNSPGGVIYVFDADVDPEDSEHPQGLKHHIGQITWVGNVVEWIEVKESRQREGIATEMFKLARSCAPDLRHADDTYLSDKARAWIMGMEAMGERRGPMPWSVGFSSGLARCMDRGTKTERVPVPRKWDAKDDEGQAGSS